MTPRIVTPQAPTPLCPPRCPTPFPPFFFNEPATTEIYPLSLHHPLPISRKLPSSAPSALKAPLPCPTLSRSLPRIARPNVGSPGAAKYRIPTTAFRTTGFDTGHSRLPLAAVAQITWATQGTADQHTHTDL